MSRLRDGSCTEDDFELLNTRLLPVAKENRSHEPTLAKCRDNRPRECGKRCDKRESHISVCQKNKSGCTMV